MKQDNGPRAMYELARKLEREAQTYGADTVWPDGWRDAVAAIGRARALVAREVLRSRIELEQRLARLGAKIGPALEWARTMPGSKLTPQELADRIVRFEWELGEQITVQELSDLDELVRMLLEPSELAAEVAELERHDNSAQGDNAGHDNRTAHNPRSPGASAGARRRDPELERQRQLDLAAIVDAARARADTRRR